MSHIRITCPDANMLTATVEMNGQPIDRLSAIEFGLDLNNRAWVKLTLVPDSVEIVGNMLVYANVALPFADRGR